MAGISSLPKLYIFVDVRMNPWELFEYVGETLVFIGVVGEVFAEWDGHERNTIANVSSIVLIIGLALSLAALIGTNKHFNGTIANLNSQAAESNKEAGKANERADKAGLEAAQLRVKAEELEEKILEQGPRDLLLYGKREEDFMNAIRQFKRQKIQIRRCVFGNNEVRDTAERLTVLFKNAGWMVSPNSPDWGESNCMLVGPNEPTPSGIWVGTPSPRSTPRTRERGKVLVRILGQVPLAATLHVVRIETARASESRESIQGQYGDPDSLVVTVLAHPSEAVTHNSTAISPFAIGP